ncbi:acetyl/propionyl/methylcrotonyl-CoA carboxylase subunit alpha [Simiduia curdlanivorans]|uniref:Acetyl/propionyl/methylcrotonyl-CoA carboxylase subunit alpha n=1 Tax=Simiduia curdlanivorans TaxID=1492769 RepID=A0ABV8V0T9_9GAMM|nr:acetyl/propionyl/methylcrotonyl-CoA carboxylase subunit alpha [Simiduia curdlanivorans]MDN3637645.1 acetyl/propionyl/methylcrotonyl-CoA carboxylase subunit alpha [Simiduia curdlanivorans]
MFSKILIANRGEIACRVIRTARKLGIRTVAVYSDADRHSLHVAMADEAIHIGPAPSRESYLCGDKILAAALKTKAEAIHPGYGFLSENAGFAKACAEQGVVFIGPPLGAIEAMGSKSAAKTIMEKAGVPLVPGYHGDDQSPALIKKHANAMGYPVLLKAAAGGGGKGMRQVWSEAEFDEALNAAKREAMNAFGDDKMLVEKYLTQPRHVEIQVFCDNHSNGVYLFERDCSVQRRHQKVVEEAPAPGMDPALRSAMGEAALTAAQAISYAGAGTVEFLLDHDGSFYFMEMNTRLQVEHPVTEMITHQDLVEWQLRVAADEILPLSQDQLRIDGHSFETRIYAEDPDKDFLPVTGTLSYLETPLETPHVRVETGVRQGDEVSVYYDPMIAKLVVWGRDRDSALRRLQQALSEYRIGGMTTNLSFLYNLISTEPFRAADLDTGFIEKHQSLIFKKDGELLEQYLPFAALYLALAQTQAALAAAAHVDANSPWNRADAWRVHGSRQHKFSIRVHSVEHLLIVDQQGDGPSSRYLVSHNGQTRTLQGNLVGNHLIADMDGHRQKLQVTEDNNHISLFCNNHVLNFSRQLPDIADQADMQHAGGLTAPMNGTLVTQLVKVGQPVEAGTPLLVMEAMKMEHTIKAPAAGQVKQFFFAAGELVDGGALLVDFEKKENE